MNRNMNECAIQPDLDSEMFLFFFWRDRLSDRLKVTLYNVPAGHGKFAFYFNTSDL